MVPLEIKNYKTGAVRGEKTRRSVENPFCWISPQEPHWLLSAECLIGNASPSFDFRTSARIHIVYYERVVRSAAMFRRFNFSFLGISSSGRQQTHTHSESHRWRVFPCVFVPRENTLAPRRPVRAREPFWILMLKWDSALQPNFRLAAARAQMSKHLLLNAVQNQQQVAEIEARYIRCCTQTKANTWLISGLCVNLTARRIRWENRIKKLCKQLFNLKVDVFIASAKFDMYKIWKQKHLHLWDVQNT